jgi:AbrB family looped-hinge helix DNA binding protein
MRVTSKGQVTIPIELRQRFGIEPGTEVEFDAQDGAIVIRRKTTALTPAQQHIKWMVGRGKGLGMTTDEIMALTRGED